MITAITKNEINAVDGGVVGLRVFGVALGVVGILMISTAVRPDLMEDYGRWSHRDPRLADRRDNW